MSAEEISALLPEGSAFLLISSTETATYLFAVRNGELDWQRAPIGAAALEDLVSKLRGALDPDSANRGATTLTGNRASRGRAFDRGSAYEIYRQTLQPIAGFIADAELYVVTDGPLASLPLSVLVRSRPQGADDDPLPLRDTDWMALAHPMTLLPTPAALRLAALQRQRSRAELPFIGC